MRFPQFIGIGTRRCGSSWVHHILNGHPDVGKPPSGLHFFSEHYERGSQWYADQLAPYADRQVLLEFSVSYLYPDKADLVAPRIEATLGQPQLFVCLRDPVERAFSDYLRSVRMLEVPSDLSFEDALRQHPEFLDRGRYGRLLTPFYERFGRSQIQPFFFHDLEADRSGFAEKLVGYLGLSRPIPAAAMQREEPKGKSVRSPRVSAAIRTVKAIADGTAAKLGFADAWSNFKGRHVERYEKLLELNHKPTVINPDTERRLRLELSDDIAALEALTGQDLKVWRHGR